MSGSYRFSKLLGTPKALTPRFEEMKVGNKVRDGLR